MTVKSMFTSASGFKCKYCKKKAEYATVNYENIVICACDKCMERKKALQQELLDNGLIKPEKKTRWFKIGKCVNCGVDYIKTNAKQTRCYWCQEVEDYTRRKESQRERRKKHDE